MTDETITLELPAVLQQRSAVSENLYQWCSTFADRA